MTQSMLFGLCAAAILAIAASAPASGQQDGQSDFAFVKQRAAKIQKKAKGLDGSGQMTDFELQRKSARHQKAMTLRSNAARKHEQSKKKVIRNLQ